MSARVLCGRPVLRLQLPAHWMSETWADWLLAATRAEAPGGL